MILPKITYNNGTPQTLAFTYPPIMKPGSEERDVSGGSGGNASRVDTIALNGNKQSINWRTDRFRTLQLDYVPAADIPAWEAFIDYAITGASFLYYPDATDSWASTEYTLEDQNWSPELNFKTTDGGMFKFTLRMRRKAT